MVAVKEWRLFCEQDNRFFYINSVNEPVCPNDSEHIVTATSLDDMWSIVPDRLFLTLSEDFDISPSTDTITFDTLSFSNTSDITYSSGELTFLRSGKFQISYHLTGSVLSGNARTMIMIQVEHYGVGAVWTLVNGSKTYITLQTQTCGRQTTSNNIPLNIQAGDKIRIVGQKESGSANISFLSSGSSLSVQAIDEF